MKLAVAMLCLIGVILAFSWGRLPLGNSASPTDVRGAVFDNVGRNFR